MDKTGVVVIPAQFDRVGESPPATWRPPSSSRWGYIGTDGKFVVNPTFDKAEPFSEGLAVISPRRLFGQDRHRRQVGRRADL